MVTSCHALALGNCDSPSHARTRRADGGLMRTRAALTVLTTVAAMSGAWATLLPTPPAVAALCEQTKQNVIGGDAAAVTTDYGRIMGFKADIIAYDFPSAPCHSVRSMDVWTNGNNNVQLGGRKVDGDGCQQHG